MSAEKQNTALLQQANNEVNVSKHCHHYWVVTVAIGTTVVHTSTTAAISVTQRPACRRVDYRETTGIYWIPYRGLFSLGLYFCCEAKALN